MSDLKELRAKKESLEKRDKEYNSLMYKMRKELSK